MEKLRDRNSRQKMHDFPDELIREILHRLPVKSLLRFRSVCKSWKSLISDPLFAKSHFELASNSTDRLMYLTASQIRSIDVNASFHDDLSVRRHNFPLAAPFRKIQILGSCRGFLLLGNLDNLFVWNPSTGSCKKLSCPPILPEFFLRKYVLGYDSSTDDYVVVRGDEEIYPFNEGHFEINIEFLSLKNNTWEKYWGTHLANVTFFEDENTGTFVNGAIHWLAYGPDAQDHTDTIIAFDLAQKNTRLLPLPDFDDKVGMYMFGILGGYLSFSIVRKCKTEIWVMKEYGLKSSWAKSIIVPVGETQTKYFVPKCFIKGDEIVGTYGGEGLMKCNHQGELLEQVRYGHAKYNSNQIMYTESLLELPGRIGAL